MRFKIILFIFIAFWGVMIARLYHVSIKSNYYYEELAKENIERQEFIKPVRGEIIDSNGNLLAMNQMGFSVSIAPHFKSNGTHLEEITDTLVDIFPDLNKTVMLKVYNKYNSPYNHNYIKVVNFIHYPEMMGAYPKLSLNPKLKIEAEMRRYYPYGQYAAHIVGYTGKSNQKENAKDPVVKEVGKIGKTGMERQYNDILQGKLGHMVSKVTATNKVIEVLEKVPPEDNRNIQLNIDINLQTMLHKRFGEDAGVAIVMRTNGDILAAVSYPSFDPNLFVGGISVKKWRALQENVDRPFTNKYVHGTYPPGSTIKMGMALAFSKAKEKILDQDEYCSGYITLGRHKHKFRCWSRWGHGKVDLQKAIRESCDVFFYNKSLKVGINAIAKHLREFGLGVKTGVDMPREFSGVIPDKAWKKRRFNQPWYMGETVIASIGQGYDLVTPLQVSRYTALMATSRLVTPKIAKVIDGKKVKKESKKVVFDPKYHKIIKEGMYDVCNHKKGTAFKTLSKLPVVVAGKTGTSQVVSIPQATKKRLKEEELEYYSRSHAWITTYAPYEDPQYVVTVLVEHGGHGGSTAGPIAADIYKWLYENGYFKKSVADKF
ncbi:MAG: penicillin-binding protein 2 [Sulfurimonas sp.]